MLVNNIRENMSRYPIEKSSEIFLEIARRSRSKITEHDSITDLLSELHTRLGGLVILDFLDLSNWDRIEAFSLDSQSGILTLTWHDFRGPQDRAEREATSSVFPGEVYACALQVNSVVPVLGPSSAVFLINGYSKTEKDIRRLYEPHSEDLVLQDNSFFEKRVVRKVKGQVHLIDFHCTPIYSLAIVPKRANIGSDDSRRILYAYNFAEAQRRLASALSTLDELTPSMTDEIAEKVNTARRIMEFVLKVECCARDLEPQKEYSQVRLGDLIATVKDSGLEKSKGMLPKLAQLANEFSHDTGKVLQLKDARTVIDIAYSYIQLVTEDLGLAGVLTARPH